MCDIDGVMQKGGADQKWPNRIFQYIKLQDFPVIFVSKAYS